jgi:hypothetical protein
MTYAVIMHNDGITKIFFSSPSSHRLRGFDNMYCAEEDIWAQERRVEKTT